MEALIAKYHLHPIIDHFTIALLGMGVLADFTGYVVIKCFSDRFCRFKALGERLKGAALVILIPGATSAFFLGLREKVRPSGSGIPSLLQPNTSFFRMQDLQHFSRMRCSART